MQSHLTFAVQLARQAGELILPYYRKAGLHLSLKADKSVVTEADLAADHWIAGEIKKAYPDDILLSEELSTTSPTNTGGNHIWIIDPIDGTTNFSLGLHIWGVLIAHLVGGWPEDAVLYFPVIDELYTARRGEGAFFNGAPLQVRPPDPNRPSAFFSCCSRTYRRYHVSIPYKARILGSSAYSFCAVARGAAIVSFETTTKIWDIAGAWLLVREAGGEIETYDGSQPFPIKPAFDYAKQSFPTLAAATPELLLKSRQQIQPKENKK
jgi:myo-inositol-1(or 4)-monophosphatase